MGRPSGYSEAIGLVICERLANGESLRSICRDPDMPGMSSVFRWLADEENAAFREHYVRAREAQADALADEILDIADDASGDYAGEGEEAAYNPESVQRAKLRVDARKWLASKLLPKKYGEASLMKLAGADGESAVQTALAVTFINTPKSLEDKRGDG